MPHVDLVALHAARLQAARGQRDDLGVGHGTWSADQLGTDLVRLAALLEAALVSR